MSTSFFTQNSGFKVIVPGGQSQHGPEAFAAGFRWATINLMDGKSWDDWAGVRDSLTSAGIRVAAGGRVENGFPDYLEGAAHLLGLAIEHDVDCVLNIEDEFKTVSPAQFEARIAQILAANPGYKREVVINTVGWLYNDVDYTPIAHRAVLLQLYVEDNRWTPDELPQKTADCFSHAGAKGFTDIGATFQAWGSALPSWYAFWGAKPRSYFSGDTIGSGLGGGWSAWAVPPQAAPVPTPAPEPASGPTAEETRQAIAKAAREWEATHASTRLSRIAIARRVVESGSHWTHSTARQIKAALDAAGVPE